MKRPKRRRRDCLRRRFDVTIQGRKPIKNERNFYMELTAKRFDELTPRELYDILRLRVDVFVVEQQC